MRLALEQAGMHPSDVHYINAYESNSAQIQAHASQIARGRTQPVGSPRITAEMCACAASSTPQSVQPAAMISARRTVVSLPQPELLQQAEDAFTEAEQALQDGDLAGYADATERARDLISQALEAAGATASPEGGGAGEGGEGDTEAGAGG